MSKPALVKFRALNLGSCAIALQRRCAALAVCRFRQAASALICVVAVSAAQAQDPIPGSLDLSFGGGTGKIANLAIGMVGYGTAVALQPDGKIVVAGGCSDGIGSNFCAARVNADGALDTSFDGPNGNGNGAFQFAIASSSSAVTSIALQADGKIVLAGSCDSSNYRFCIARLNSDGSLDSSFDGPSGGANGSFLVPFGLGGEELTAVAIQPDGKILLLGHCANGSNNYFCVARLNHDGSFDAGFDGPSGSANGRFLLPIGASDGYATSAVIQSDGRIVLAGHCWDGSYFDFCVARLNTNGSLDATFVGPSGNGNGGFLVPVGARYDYARSVGLQSDGKIVLAGNCYNEDSNHDFCLVRLTATGALDTSFNGPSGNGNGKFLLPVGLNQDYARALALQPDGKIILSGECHDGSAFVFCVARLQTDGSLDASFDGPSGTGNGKFLLGISDGPAFAKSAALQPDGKIVLAGSCYDMSNSGSFCLARLNGGPFGAKQCSLDLDGDGKVLATTDMLIGTRVALGMTGSTVLNGITFAAHAARKTWPEIRTFLVSQCGMAIAP